MSRKLLCLISFIVVLGMAAISPAGLDDDPNLAGYWKFDGDTLDSSGNGRDGTLMGGAALLEVGLHGGAISFDGSSGYVNIDGYKGVNAVDGVQHAFSIANWVRCTFSSGNREMVTWGTSAGRQRLTWRVHESTLRTEHASGNLRGNTIVNDGEWHHVALTVAEGANLRQDVTKLYVDGVEDTYKSGSDNPYELTPNVDVRIGMSGPQNGRYFLGDLDDVRIYDRVLDPNEIAQLAIRPKSYKPDPAVGALVEDVSVLLGWTAGGYAVEHDVYIGNSAELGADQLLGRQATTSALATGLEKDTTYYWRVDDITADGTVIAGITWNFWVPPRGAYNLSPIDGNKILGTSANLTWTAGFSPIMHQVYFGTDADQVANAAGAPLVMDIGYDTGELQPDTTYYWRVDEFYGIDTVKGAVLSFSTVPVLPLSDDPNLVGQWTFDGDSGGVVLDQSGHGGHAALVGGVQLVEGVVGEALEFDGSGYAEATGHTGVTGTQSRTVMAWINTANYGEIATWGLDVAGQKWIFRVQESNGTLGAIRVEVNGGYRVGSIDVRDDEWHHVAAVLADDGSPDIIEIELYVDGFREAISAELDEPINTADGVVRIGKAPWGTRAFTGLIDDVRIYDKTFTEDEMRQLHGDLAMAWQPQPAFGATADIVTTSALSWTPGDGAAEHDVYIGTNAAAVAAADASDATGIYRGRQAGTTYVAGLLDFGTAYYWRVDEVAADGTVATGRVWPFSTEAELVIYDEATPLDYDTSVDPFVSEISLDLDPAQDWTDPIGRLAVNYTGNAAPGSVTVDEAAGTTTVVGRGDDIWGTADQFQYAYTMITGNGSMTVKVDSLANTHDWTKAGIMIRENLSAGSPFAMIAATGVNGVRFQARTMADQSATADDAVATAEAKALAAPVWIKIERMFPMVNAYYSTDGVTFVPMGWNPQVIPMSPAPIYIGLAVTSHSGANTYADAVFSELSSDGGVTPGPLTSVEIGLTGNAAAPMSLVLTDASGASAAVVNPDAAATQQTSATDFIVDLADYNIDLTAVVKATLVLGDGTPGGSGSITINNVRLLGPKGPVAYWALDETSGTTAADSSASGGNDGTLVGDMLEWRPGEGQIGGALLFGGVLDSYMEFPSAGISTDSGTLALWGNLAQPQPAQTRYFFGHTTIPPYGSRIQLYMDGENTELDLGLGGSHSRKTGMMTLETETWYHIALTWDAGDYVVYVNGQAVAADVYTGLDSLNSVADIGNDGNTNGRTEGFGGLIDDVRIYDRALTAGQVAKLAGL